MDHVDTVVVGAGQAGLAVSRLLAEAGVRHVVFERGRVGESWRSQRWDSFALNTPNWANLLPGSSGWSDQEVFADRDELVAYLEGYAGETPAPVREQCAVLSVVPEARGGYAVTTTAGRITARNVVVCSGSMSVPVVPALADDVPGTIDSISAAEYRRPGTLADGAVVVVGSGQSGCQIAEELLESGRRVFLCVSKVARIPRRYRGRDIVAWLVDLGFFDVAVDELDDPAARFVAQPQVSGTRGGHTISLQSLARDGAVLLGRAERVSGTVLHLRQTVEEAVAFGDATSAEFKASIDRYIAANGLDAPRAEPDPNDDVPMEGQPEVVAALDLEEAGVATIIWCVGFVGDFSWLAPDLLDDQGVPRHRRGVADVPGLYCVGFPWLSKRKSGILLGIEEDAGRVVRHLLAQAA